MSDCRYGVSPVNYPDPDLDPETPEDTFSHDKAQIIFRYRVDNSAW